MTDVYLHIGLAKTGTSSIQAALGASKEALAADSTLFPGRRHHDQRLAAYDLLGRRIQGSRDVVPGSLRRLVEEIDRYDGQRVIVSEELLSLARPPKIRRLARVLQGHRLFVVVGVRDLTRTIPSSWAQEVVKGGTFTLREYVDAVRDPSSGAPAGVAFWIRQDLLRVLVAWQAVVPAERIRLVTVPHSGAGSNVLLERFGQAVGLAFGELTAVPRENEALDLVGVEVIRRLNERLGGSLNRQQQLHVVDRTIRPGLTAAGAGAHPLRLPDEDLAWVGERSQAVVDAIRERGYQVFGDLSELLPPSGPAGSRSVPEPSPEELLTATEEALVTLAGAHGRQFSRLRRTQRRQEAAAPLLERTTSEARAVGFRLREAALSRADRSSVLGWAARTYLKRTAG